MYSILSRQLVNRSSTRLPLSRPFHQSLVADSQRKRPYEKLRKELGSDFDKQILNVKDAVDNLKILQAERTLKGHPDIKFAWKPEAAFYRDAIRDLTQAFPPAQFPSREIPLSLLTDVLTDENSVAWRMVANMVESGKVPEIESLGEEMRAAILFHTVHGIGEVKAKDLAHEGFRTLKELAARPDKLGKSQKLGLEHYEDMQTLISHDEITTFKGLFEEALHKMDPEIQFEICGSYRRGNPLCSDIDIIAWHPSYNDRNASKNEVAPFMEMIWIALRNAGLAHEDKILGKGPKKIMALTQLPETPGAKWRQVDIRLSTLDSLPYTMLALSGDDTLIKLMRRVAKDHHRLVLNEYEMGVRKTDSKTTTQAVAGSQIIVKEEKEIFERLGLPYIEPTQRNYKTWSNIMPKKFM